MSGANLKTRLLLNNNHTDLEAFKEYVRAIAPLKPLFAVRVAISHHHKLKFHEKRDADDPYLYYSLGFAALCDFVPPKALASFLDAGFVRRNVLLLRRKHEILEEAGLGAAFVGHEPVYYPEAIFRKYPEWRGPRIDHPRRSRNPCFAMCMHQEGVRTLYQEMAEALVKLCPGMDTFYFWANDSGSGFCWHPGSYFGANGPEACSSIPPAVGWNAFQSAILSGARRGGVVRPMSVVKNTSSFRGASSGVEGAFEADTDEARGRFYSIGADLSHTYPIVGLHDPFAKCERWANVLRNKPEYCNVWLSDAYHRTALDTESVKDLVALILGMAAKPQASLGLTVKVRVLNQLAAERFGEAGADLVVDGWEALAAANATQKENLRGAFFANPTYLGLSHRWLLRPWVAFEERLSPEERSYYMPHIFSPYGEAGKLELLDAHGKCPLPPNSDYGAFDSTADKIIAHYQKAAACFSGASLRCKGKPGKRLLRMAHGCLLLICLWKNVRNGMQFALLRKNGHEESMDEIRQPFIKAGHPIGWLNDYQKILFRTVRNELDNIDTLVRLLREDTSRAFFLAESSGEEETFSLGPKVVEQLLKRKRIMQDHIQDLYRLYPNTEVTTPLRY